MRRRLLALSVLMAAISGATAQSSGSSTAEERARDRVVKEQRDDGSLVLDESGLTAGFEQMRQMMRTTASLPTAHGEVVVHVPRIPGVGPDWKAAEALIAGDRPGTLEFQVGGAIKLRTEVDLAFEGAAVPAGNIVAGHAGLYSLWLERDAAGAWQLVFNREPDVWGTMRDRAADVARTPIEYSRRQAPSGMMSTSLLAPDAGTTLGGGGHRLVIAWGPHQWSAGFALAP
ncbi:MAG: DUF2911 domain-containing protein [Acidobacteria bacterium]|nr:MAG: DUF2911 domain-containing protein [Acidobacteriota bacterium]REK10562.1 MAG: DUF2911 domain-containing protein [Acidobacteriota bacterium]